MGAKDKLTFVMVGAALVLLGQLLPGVQIGPLSPVVQIAIVVTAVGLFSLTFVVSKASAREKTMCVDFDIVVCRGLRIVDEAGRVLAQLHAGGSGGRLTLRDATGNDCVRISASSDGGQLRILGSDGETRADMGTWPLGGYMSAYNLAGKPCAVVSVDSEGGYVSLLNGHDGRRRVAMAAGSGNGWVRTFDSAKRETGGLPLTGSETVPESK